MPKRYPKYKFPNFLRDISQMDEHEIEDYLYNEVVPVLEESDFHLSLHGIHANTQSRYNNMSRYNEEKEKRELFDIPRVKKTFKYLLNQRYAPMKRKKVSSYGLKHRIEKHLEGIKYVTNGECILAFLLNGYEISKYDDKDINCWVYTKL